MTDLNRALLDIRDIRRQMTETTVFRGYGPLTLFATAALALAAGAVQATWLPGAGEQPLRYVALWLCTGVVCAGLIATQMLARANRLHRGIADEMIQRAVGQFLPAAVVGLLLPVVLLRANPSAAWMLPGLWQVVFGLGVFASSRGLPKRMKLAGCWFLLTGMAALFMGDARALAPGVMALPYAVGMSLVAAIHYRASAGATRSDDDTR